MNNRKQQWESISLAEQAGQLSFHLDYSEDIWIF